MYSPQDLPLRDRYHEGDVGARIGMPNSTLPTSAQRLPGKDIRRSAGEYPAPFPAFSSQFCSVSAQRLPGSPMVMKQKRWSVFGLRRWVR